jgi:hypothetical protein
MTNLLSNGKPLFANKWQSSKLQVLVANRMAGAIIFAQK